MNSIEKFVELFPEKEKVMREIWNKRKDIKTETKIIGKTPDGKDIYFTNDPEQMLLCGATILSSYSPDSPSFVYLPTLVLQPYIGMIYVRDGSTGLYIATEKGNIVAPKYLSRAFVMHKDLGIVAKFPTYSERGRECDLEEWESDEHVIIESDTPPIEIHLDCLDQLKKENGHVAVFGKYITPQEQLDMYRQTRKEELKNDNGIL